MLIDVKNLYKIYNEGKENEVRAVDGIDLQIDRGEFVAILGASGSGKSTLMNMLGCLDVPTSGEYYLHGHDVASMSDDELSDIRNQEIGFVFQGFNLIPSLTALENVELPLIYRGVGKKERMQLSDQALDKVGLGKRKEHKPSEMSGGQQQRVAIARALIHNRSILLVDEGTSALDQKNADIVEKSLLANPDLTLILVSHHLTEARKGQFSEVYELEPPAASYAS